VTRRIPSILLEPRFSLLLIIVFAIVTLSILSFRGTPIGVDSYAYMAYSFGIEENMPGENPVVLFLFGLLPKNFFLWNLTAILLIVTSSFIVWNIGKHLNPQVGHWAGVIAWMGFWWQYILLGLEPHSFGFPLCLAATYYFIRDGFEASERNIGLLILAGIIWPGAFIFLVMFAVYDYLFVLPALGVLIFHWSSFVSAILPKANVFENTPLVALLFVLLYSFRFASTGKFLDFKFDERLFKFVGVSVIFSAFASKLALFSIPFLALNRALRLEANSVQPLVYAAITLFAVFGFAFVATTSLPTTETIEAVEETVARGPDVQNDWGLGHYVAFFGGDPSYRYGPADDRRVNDFACDSRPVLSTFDLNEDFRVVWQKGNYKIYECVYSMGVVPT